ncbi:VOC family protein [Nesterenkonia haasae]|uniref:VOC family protein n=1 Tax=Nesterenkonia haasae TaxID=2587813 RepID=UPI002E2A0B10|nr:VOC family protein [Nesterenkonia haasae]
MNRPFTIALPTSDRQRTYTFYQETLGLEPIGEPTEDGVPEPLQFRIDENSTVMFIPTGGFGWVLGDRMAAPRNVSECLLTLTVQSPTEVSASIERMRAGGGGVFAAPAQQDWGFSGVATDPDGHAWQIIALN